MPHPRQMLTVYLARHGESTCSCRGVLCGSECDAALTERGEAEARALATRFGVGAYDAIYSSPQRRARHTARLLAQRCGIDVLSDERLREITYGAWDGLRRERVPAMDLVRFSRGEASAPEGESLADVAERVAGAFAEVRARHDQGTVWIFSHHTTLRLLLGHILGVAPTRYRTIQLAPASISVLTCEAEAVTVIQLGLTDHLSHPRYQGS